MLRHAFLSAILGAASVAPAAEPPARPTSIAPRYSVKYHFPRKTWPALVVVRVPVSVRIFEKGEAVGTVRLRPGVKLRVLDLTHDGFLLVEFAGAQCVVDHAATNFIESLRP